MGIAVLAFASCTHDTIKETNNGRAIDFRVVAETKASEITTANLNSFYVTAIDEAGANYFTDVAYTKVGNYFLSSPSYFWPGDESSLAFYAYAPSAYDLGIDVSITNEGQKLLGFAPAAYVDDQLDFVTATATGSIEDEGDGVALTFKHQLAQIEVKARNANPAYVYTVKGVKIANVASEANFDFAKPANPWTLTPGAKDSYSITYDDERVLNSYGKNLMSEDGNNLMLLPQQLTAWNPADENSQGAYIAVLANITTAEGAKVFPTTDETYAWLAIPVDTEWEAGFKYVYTLDFTKGAGYPEGDPDPIYGDPIKFIVNVTPWNEQEGTETELTSPLVGVWNLEGVKSVFSSSQNHNDIFEAEWAEEDVEALVQQVSGTILQVRFESASTFYLYGANIPFEVTEHDGKPLFFYDVDLDNYIYIASDNPFTLHIPNSLAEPEEIDGKTYDKLDQYIIYKKQ